MSVSCRNCDTSFDGNFCPNCGQKSIDLERPISDLVGEILRETFEVDGRAARTLKTLFLQPGALTGEFLAGRRRWFTPPIRLYLAISIAFFVLVAWLASRGLLLDPGQDLERDAASQAQFMSNELPRLMFVLLPVFAVLLKIVFRSRLYFDHLIFSVHLHSAAFIVLALMLPLERVASHNRLALVAQLIVFFYFLIYFVLCIRRVYDASWAAASLKSLVILFGYLAVVTFVIETSSSILILSD